MNLPDRSIFKKLQFTDEWVKLGLLTPEILDALERQYTNGKDDSDEHYRWQTFRKFLAANTFIEPEIFLALDKLGKNDPDITMGGAIRRELLHRDDCPVDLIKKALDSDEQFLINGAEWAIKRRNLKI